MLKFFNNIKHLLLGIIAGLYSYASNAQQSDIKFTSLTTKNGLSSNTVNAILKDRSGLMWFGTADGLNKFDGTNVTVYRHNVHDGSSITANNILSLHEDRLGRLWIGTGGGGLCYYDRNLNNFVQYKLNRSKNTKNNQGVRAIYDDHFGNIWVSTYGGGLQIIDKKNNVIKLSIDEGFKYRPTDHVILNFFEDSKKRMWLGTNQGLLLYNWASKKFTHFLHSDSDPKSISNNVVKMVTEDADGNIWLATFGGVNLLLPDGKTFKAIRNSKSLESITNDNVYAITAGPSGKVWVGTDEGLNLLDPKTFKTTRFKPDSRDNFSLNNKYIRSMYFDKGGITWIGTLQGGVNKFDKNLPLFNLKISNAFDPSGLAAPVVTAFAEYRDDYIFVGTDGGGLHLFNKKTGLFKRYKIVSRQKRSLNATDNISILSLEMDRLGKLWIGTLLDGFFQFDPATGSYKQFLSPSAPFEVNQNDIYFIKRISNNDIWIGSNGSGVTIYESTTKTFKRFKSHPQTANDLVLPLNGFMRAIAEDKYGNIWLGSWGSGIAVFNPTNQKFSVYNESNSSLPNNEILSILHDSKGQTWVSTNGGGLNYFDNKTKKFISSSEKDGLANYIIYKILEDSAGILWLSTNKGINKFDKITKKFENFTSHNGVQNSPFLVGSGLRTSSNELFFGGQNGFNYFKPENLPTTILTPRVLLTDLKVSNNAAEPEKSAPVKNHISVSKEISLKYGQNFSISYVAVNYTTPQRNQFSYKLVGFDDDWNFVGSARTAYYTNIYPGEYTFIVRGGDINGLWNNGTAIKIKVLPPIWMTIYAYITYLIIVVGVLLYIRHRGIQKLRAKFLIEQEKIQAQQLIDEEKRAIERQHEVDLQKIKFITNLSHEFRTPISLILAPIEKLTSSQVAPDTASQINVIKRNAKRLLYLVNQLLDFRKMGENELKINLSSGNLIDFIKDVTESFYDLSERKKIELHFDSIIESLPAKFDHDKIERIIFNLLSNAFKFTYEGGTVRLQVFTLTEKGNQPHPLLYFRVIDTGIGIPKEHQSKIFDNFFQYNEDSSILNQGSGIGLSIVKEFVSLLGGEICLESTVGHGTTFTIKLPVIPLTGDSPTIIPKTTPIINQDQPNDVITDNVVEIKDMVKTPILLVEDNDDFRFYLKDNLKSTYHIIEASNGKEGWQKALSSHPQLIVTDISMPYLNGIELSRKLKGDKRTSHIPVIMLTATTGEQSQITGLQSGANDYLTKPFNFEILNAKIKNLLLLNDIFKDTYSRQITVTGSDIEIESGETKLISAVMSYIEEKLNAPDLSVEDLSKHVGMSRGSLYNKLLEITGLTPVEYIRSVKLDKAAILLEKSDYTVAEVAYMTGFGTPSYFSKQFKAKFNMLPSEYVSSKRKHNAR